jgi:NAD(P)-dependent dehydrogenase (short-subunit alcohol dehydrogenase family)
MPRGGEKLARLRDRVAVVTGGTSGMGAAIARTFAAEGASVVIGGRNVERATEVVSTIRSSGGQAEFVTGEVGTPEVNQELVDTATRVFGHLDLLVPNAGVLGLGSITELSIDSWHQTISTNLHSVFYLLRCGIPKLQEAGGGSVVVISSIAAYKGFPNHPAYCASKGALLPLVRQVATDYAPSIRVNAICPGPVDTPLIWDSAKAFSKPDEAVAAAAERTLLKRLGTPEDVAAAALFLASEESEWLTGAAITLDGGIMCT